MNIDIIGAGGTGRTLAARLATPGHDMELAVARGAEEAVPISMTRRAFALGSAVSVLLAACHEGGLPSSDMTATDVKAPDDPVFLSLSRVLTGHADIDPLISARTSQAFRQLFPEVAASFGSLGILASRHPLAEDMLRAATAPGHHEAALAIVAAWYTGTVGNGVIAKPIAYADALMNRPVADALFPPTYQFGGPAWWVAAPPPADLQNHITGANGTRQTAGKSQA